MVSARDRAFGHLYVIIVPLEPLAIESVHMAEVFIRPDAPVVSLFKIMDYMHELRRGEVLPEESRLGIAGAESGEPVVRHENGWSYIHLAAVLKTGLGEDSTLVDAVLRTVRVINALEGSGIVQKNYLYPADNTLVKANADPLALDFDFDIPSVLDPIRVAGKVVFLILAVVLVVRRNDIDVVSKFSEPD